MDNWGDISASAIVPLSDDSTNIAESAIGSPASESDMAKSGFDVSGMPYLTVSNNPTAGQYSDIQEAINALQNSRYEGIYIMNGTYTLSAPIYIPDVNMHISGESQGGVIIENNAGDEAFYINGYTSNFSISNMTIDSQNVAAYSNLIYEVAGSGTIRASNISINCVDAGGVGTNGDYGIYSYNSSSRVICSNITVDSGKYGIAVVASANTQEEATIINFVGTGQTTRSLYISSAEKGFISNATITDVYDYGIYVAGADSMQIIGCHISGNNSARTGIYATGSYAVIADNDIDITKTNTDASQVIALYAYQLTESVINGNTININIDAAANSYGILLYTSCNDCVVTSNIVTLDNANGGAFTDYLLAVITTSDRNIINNNNLDGVTNAGSIGIYLAPGCDNNQGTSNITYRVATSVTDFGAGNTVTAKDV